MKIHEYLFTCMELQLRNLQISFREREHSTFFFSSEFFNSKFCPINFRFSATKNFMITSYFIEMKSLMIFLSFKSLISISLF